MTGLEMADVPLSDDDDDDSDEDDDNTAKKVITAMQVLKTSVFFSQCLG